MPHHSVCGHSIIFLLFCFRDTHDSGPDILSAKTGHELPVLEISDPDPEVFAAYTAPDGGLTSITKIEDQLTATSLMREADHSEDFDYIDLGEDSSTGNSDRASPSARKRNSSSTNNPIELGSTISEY